MKVHSRKIKQNNPKVQKVCTNCFNPKFIKFNFSFLKYDDELETKDIIQLYERLKKISKEPYLIVSSWDKKIGFENENLNIAKEIPIGFEDGNRRFDGKYTVIRLYPNNNPTPGRIIGKMINCIFYIFYIDAKGNLYKH